MNDLLQRYRGTLVGVHVGDSIGAPYETWDAKRIAADLEARGGLGFFDYPNPWRTDGNGDTLLAGRPTDDSDQTADLAWSLVECNGLKRNHLREALRDSIVRKQSRLWNGKATGGGKTTRDALSDDQKRNESARKNTLGTNGSLMRCAPMTLMFLSDVSSEQDSFFVEVIYTMSDVTHAHPHSKQACLIYSLVMAEILRGTSKDAILDVVLSKLDMRLPVFDRVISALSDEDLIPYDPGDWPARGAAEFSLYVALHAFLCSTSFEDGIKRTVLIGGDTDTYAAIAGGLLGAYYGYKGIPAQWRKAIMGHDVMVGYADKLFELSQR